MIAVSPSHTMIVWRQVASHQATCAITLQSNVEGEDITRSSSCVKKKNKKQKPNPIIRVHKFTAVTWQPLISPPHSRKEAALQFYSTVTEP